MRLQAFLLCLIILLPTLLKVGVVSNYIVQYEKYSTELCENIDKPELSCNGKCQMMEELNNTEAEASSPVQIPSVLKVKELIADESFACDFFIFTKHLPIHKSLNGFPALAVGNKNDVFHPPCA